MDKKIYEPPLRLILTNNCNGACSFCHSEGSTSASEMPLDMVYECVDIAEKLALSKIALTGGEPTLRSDLNEIINYIQQKKKLSVSLTTNGYHLERVSAYLNSPIYKLNLSISSLNFKMAKKYQNVNPQIVLDNFRDFRALSKTINIVITEENYFELYDFIDICKHMECSLDIMFLMKSTDSYSKIKKEIMEYLINSFAGEIILQSTSVLRFNISENSYVRIKSPYLSQLLHNKICENCEQYSRCFEKVCAIRVHPNGLVTPCLTKRIVYDGKTLYSKIKKAYDSIHTVVWSNDIYK